MRKHILSIICLMSISSMAFTQLNMQVTTTSVSVSGMCDLDGVGASDPQWDIDVSDNRTYSESFDHEEGGNNGPNITISTNYDNSLNFTQTYNGICPPAFLTIDWSGYEDDALGTEVRFDQIYEWTVPTSPGTYDLSRSGSVSGCTAGVTWTINLRMIISGTADYECADDPCLASSQVVQDPCDATLVYSRYDVSSSTMTINSSSTSACNADGNNDIFFEFQAPSSGAATVWVKEWGNFTAFAQADLTGNIFEGSCNALAVAESSETVSGTSGGPHSIDCIDFSRGAFNDINNGPFNMEGLTPGQTYFMRVTEEDDQSAYIDLAFAEPLLEDNCINAQFLDGTGCNYNSDAVNEPDIDQWTGQSHTDGRDVNGDSVLDDIDNCATNWFSNENMVWYYFDIDALTAQPITITVNSIDCNDTGGGQMQMGIWKENGGGCATGTANASNGLGSMVPVGCSVGPSGIVEVTLPDNMPNDRYYVIVDGDGGAQCRWEFESVEVLPVEMDEFNGNSREETNVLDWRTLSETNNSHFEVQRSSDPTKEFKVIGTVEGKGTTSKPSNYIFIDKAPNTSSYYRLKQLDFDGSYEYTEVIHILRKDATFDISKVYPSPASTLINIKYVVNEPSSLTLTITDMLGRLISMETINAEAGIQIKELDITPLTNGVYTVTLDDGITKKVDKIIKR